MDGSFVADSLSRYPELAALVVLILGVVIARLVRNTVGRGLGVVDERMSRYTTGRESLVSPALIRFSRGLAFWLIVLFAAIAALRLLGVRGLSVALDSVMAFIPRLLVGLAIVGAGHLLGLLSRILVARLSDAIRPDSLGARLVHGAIFIVSLVMGLQQMRIDITFITQLVLVLVIVIMGGMTLAFALGARQHVANLIAQSEMRRYAVGERIRIGTDEGPIMEIHRTGMVLATSDGIASIPAARFATMRVLRLAQEPVDE